MHDLHHLLSDKLLLGCLSVASGLHLSWCLLCETDREHSHDVTIRGLSLGEGLDKGVPFLDHSTSVITSDVHTMEVGVAVESLDFIDLELELSPGGADLWVWSIAIVKGDLDDTTPETITGLLKTGSLVARHESHNSFIKSWGQHIVPLFTGEWMGSKQQKLQLISPISQVIAEEAPKVEESAFGLQSRTKSCKPHIILEPYRTLQEEMDAGSRC